MRMVANDSVSVEHIGNASTHLEKRSVITKIYLFPLEDIGRGPMMSQDIFSNGRFAVIPRSTGEWLGRVSSLTFRALLDPSSNVVFITWPVKSLLDLLYGLVNTEVATVVMQLTTDIFTQ